MSATPPDAQPAAGEEYNAGPPTPPRQAATVILLRGGAEGLELLLVKRNPHARFMGGVWVFPGGAVEQGEGRESETGMSGPDVQGEARGETQGQTEGEDDRDHRAAAVRELHEEASIELPRAEELVKFSRWITPAEVRTRFDTHFFLAPLPPGQEPHVDGQECVEFGWFTPLGALEAHRTGEILLVFPTIKHLEQLSPFPTADALLEHARGRTVHAVQPRVVVEGEVARVLLPGEPGY
jgi:8-oxo-dGTP pyrophosphatase MutT (NUDIX family)